jgi:hypothetical protein
MATSTYQTYLMYKKTSSATAYEQLIDITSFPKLFGDPEQLETTTLSQAVKTYIEGLQDTEKLAFGANYDPTDFKKIYDLKGQELPLAVYFGKDGEYGIFSWNGTVSATVDSGATNEVRKMTVNSMPASEITFSTGTAK